MKFSDISLRALSPEENYDTFNASENIFEILSDYGTLQKHYHILDDNQSVSGYLSRELIHLIQRSFTDFTADFMLNHFREAVIAVDQSGQIFYANDSYTKILGVPVKKIIGRYIQDIEPDSMLTKTLKTRKAVSKTAQHIRSIDKYVSIHVYPIFYKESFIGACSIFRDTTELIKLNEEIEQTNEINALLNSTLNEQQGIHDLNVIGQSKAFIHAVSQALVVAKTDAPVLLRGESGVGKEIFAKLIHSNSARKEKAAISINCASLPENLIESELFGYEAGSFTGALKAGKKGKFELANESTLFLDEIGEMPLTMQSKFLRVLQTGEIEKIGRLENIPVDTRIIAATNQPLEEMMEKKLFRSDLYYRLNIIEINIPPLREREGDVLLLAHHFLQKYNEKYNKNIEFAQSAIDFFYNYSWPGNVRELQNCIEHGVIMCSGTFYDIDSLSPHMKNVTSHEPKLPTAAPKRTEPYNGTLNDAIRTYEKELIKQAIEQNNGNKSKAIQQLGISRRTFYRKLAEYSL